MSKVLQVVSGDPPITVLRVVTSQTDVSQKGNLRGNYTLGTGQNHPSTYSRHCKAILTRSEESNYVSAEDSYLLAFDPC